MTSLARASMRLGGSLATLKAYSSLSALSIVGALSVSRARGPSTAWTGARVAEGSRLLSGWLRKRLAGSNPAPSVAAVLPTPYREEGGACLVAARAAASATRSQDAKCGIAPAVASGDESKAPGDSSRSGGAGVAQAPYYLTPKAAPWSFKPYDRRQAKRDRHDCHNLSHKLSAALRRLRRQAGASARASRERSVT